MAQIHNRLIHELSPYLLQHAANLVDWHPWGAEAFAKARELDRPIFLSVGYAACHWCHVMERESFTDPATAALMNEHFINIKVDREERPDVDQLYLNAVQLMSHRGGWPMSVWLTPERKPFYGGTYFPPQPRHGLPAFGTLLSALAAAWRERRDEVLRAAEGMVEPLIRLGLPAAGTGAVPRDHLLRAAAQLCQQIDPVHGGLGSAPKFPHAVEMRLLLRAGPLADQLTYQERALESLAKMIRGGIHDQLGGGFHRYATDARWRAPHFEKMLYDNALITSACLEAWQITRDELFQAASRDTLDYVRRELTAPEGGFFSTQDADSEQEEGKFFVWTRDEILHELGDPMGSTVADFFGATRDGNWESGKNVLYQPLTWTEFSKLCQQPAAALQALIAKGRQRLFEARQRRVRPATDTKILASWNGMMLEAMAQGASILGEARFRSAACAAGAFLLERMTTPDGKLQHFYKAGVAKLDGFLDDYACVANGMIALYEATFDPQWLAAADRLVKMMLAQFWDDQAGGFFYTSGQHEALLARSKDPVDGATPSGNGTAAMALARLVHFTGEAELVARLEATVQLFRGQIEQSPTSATQLLMALLMHWGPTREFVLVSGVQPTEFEEMRAALFQRFIPNKIVAALPVAGSTPPWPIFAGKAQHADPATVYVCKQGACQPPIIGLAAFQHYLATEL